MVNDPPGVYQSQQPLTFEKVWEMFQEADRRLKKTERLVRNISKNIGGIGNNIGEAAEEYFRAALAKKKEFGGVKIESVGRLNKQLKNIGAEYDVVLFGENTLIIVEVKHKLTRDDVLDFINKSLPTFKPLFPEYAGFKVLGAVAGLTAQKTAIKLAISKGLFVITQSGQKTNIINPDGFKPGEF